MQQIEIKNRKKGFSIIETLVAITILLVAIAGPLTIAHRALSDTKVVKDQVEAMFLAQDALEYVKNVRDRNNINDDLWSKDITTCSVPCTVDTVQEAPSSAFSACVGSCLPLRKDQISGLYGYDDDWDETIFTRTLTFSSIGVSEAKISVLIEWQSGDISKSFLLEDNLFDWQE